MPGWSLATIEMGIPKVIRFSILLGFYASPRTPPHNIFPSSLPVGGGGGRFLSSWALGPPSLGWARPPY